MDTELHQVYALKLRLLRVRASNQKLTTVANCFEQLGPDYVLSGDEEEVSKKPDVAKNDELTEQLPPTSPLPQPGLPEPGSDHLLENQIPILFSQEDLLKIYSALDSMDEQR
ncbi:hypothetical protein HF086_003105 [Spodoptera exigua]|uniref:Uncharacterized protein n=1 Tax=Spodoptera exigua TaxID=7107 RepID=A0A922M3V2_SPOEX|nr:hypothetical protein HF086_003105 [Spodoptera exigua]